MSTNLPTVTSTTKCSYAPVQQLIVNTPPRTPCHYNTDRDRELSPTSAELQNKSIYNTTNANVYAFTRTHHHSCYHTCFYFTNRCFLGKICKRFLPLTTLQRSYNCLLTRTTQFYVCFSWCYLHLCFICVYMYAIQ